MVHVLGRFLAVLTVLAALAPEVRGETPTFTLRNEVLHKIRPELFGHFMERASFGEAGPENALVPGTSELDPHVIELLRKMRIPLVRFPAGGDADFMDWTDLIDNAPTRKEGPRPKVTKFAFTEITNRFGFDEYFAVARELKWESVIVVNLRDAVAKKKPLKDAAIHAAGLVAYCNIEPGAALPSGMPDWPAARVKNGQPRAIKAKYFQLGNEWWLFREEAFKLAGKSTVEERLAWLVEVLTTYMDTMRAVDPSIEFVMDAPSNLQDPLMLQLWAHPEIKKRRPIATFHHYAPGPMNEVRLGDEKVDVRTLERDDLWRALVSMPGDFHTDTGESLGFGKALDYARKLGYRVCSTEWNWMSFNDEDVKAVRPAQVSGIGAANFLNGLLRESDDMLFATQSMLVGSNWPIACIQVDPAGKRRPRYTPSGFVMMLYANNHGTHVLGLKAQHVPTFRQPYQVGWSKPQPVVAALDVVATASKETAYLHLINRTFATSIDAVVDADALPLASGKATLMEFQAPEKLGPDTPLYSFITRDVTLEKKRFTQAVPPRSVSILKMQLK